MVGGAQSRVQSTEDAPSEDGESKDSSRGRHRDGNATAQSGERITRQEDEERATRSKHATENQ